MAKTVSVIIPAYNAAKTLPKCIESIMNSDFPGQFLEIIVVDNNSTDNTADIIRNYPVKYVFAEKPRRSIARNAGIKSSKGEFIAFVDADCIIDKSWFKNMVAEIEKPYIAGCGGRIVPIPYSRESLVDSFRYFECTKIKKNRILPLPSRLFPQISAANAIYRRNVLFNVGFFDESLADLEDVDLCWKVFYKGYIVKYVPAAIVYTTFYSPQPMLYFRRHFERGASLQFLHKKWNSIMKKTKFYFIVYFLDLTMLSFMYLGKSIIYKIERMENALYSLRSMSILLGMCYGWPRCFMTAGIYKDLNILEEANKERATDFSANLIFNKDIRFYFLDEYIRVSNLNKSKYFVLKDTGKRILELILEGKKIPDQIIENLTEEYDVDKREAEAALAGFMNELKQQSVLKV